MNKKKIIISSLLIFMFLFLYAKPVEVNSFEKFYSNMAYNKDTNYKVSKERCTEDTQEVLREALYLVDYLDEYMMNEFNFSNDVYLFYCIYFSDDGIVFEYRKKSGLVISGLASKEKIKDEIEKAERQNNINNGQGNYTNKELDNQRENNYELGYGRFTDSELEKYKEEQKLLKQEENNEFERRSNEKFGYGYYTNGELDKQREYNENKGFGRITDAEVLKKNNQLITEREKNQKNGYGYITDEELNIQKEKNRNNGLGFICDNDVEKEAKRNEKIGYGFFTEEQLRIQKENNEKKGIGYICDKQAENPEIVKKIQLAKQAEQNKEWVYALGYYYDVDLVKYEELANLISSGSPGRGNYNVFELHDEWVRLFYNYEKYFTEYPGYDIYYVAPTIGDIDYNKRTAKCGLRYCFYRSEKFQKITETLKHGFFESKRNDWKSIKEEESYRYEFRVKEQYFVNIDFYNEYKEELKKYIVNNNSSEAKRKSYFIENQNSMEKLRKQLEKYYNETGIASMLYHDISRIELAPSFLPHDFNDYYYDLQLCLYDENENLLCKGTIQTVKGIYEYDWYQTFYEDEEGNDIRYLRYFKETKGYSDTSLTECNYLFPDINSNIMDLIEKDKIKIKINKFSLHYGLLNKTGKNENLSFNDLVKTVPEIVYPVDSIKLEKIEIDLDKFKKLQCIYK